ncbi:MAG: hypothetical protein QXQ57_03870 [Sulfolobales archaeon]
MRKQVFAELLDNLWFWGALALAILVIYGVWALLEATGMHGMPGIIPRGWG